MRLVVVNLAYLPELRTPEDLLHRFSTFGPWTEAVLDAARDTGDEEARVVVVQRFHHDAVVDRNGVTYRFVNDGRGVDLRWWQSSPAAMALTVAECRDAARRRQPSVIHLNSLGYAAFARRLHRSLPPNVPIVIQHHAEKPRIGLSAILQRWALFRADGFIFAARGLADDWLDRGAIRGDAPIFEVMEGSTLFTTSDREASRRLGDMDGSPVFLWVGRLDDNKDPFTVLAGFEMALHEMPDARLHMAYGPDSPLERSVKERIAQSDILRGAVRLLGTVPHGEMEMVFQSADYFVLGSRYEGSGFALAEALACGVVPIVTDIPSFRMMTDDGGFGALWQPGQPEALVAAITRALGLPLGGQSRAARAFFDRRLSYTAIGRGAVAAYRSVLRAKNG